MKLLSCLFFFLSISMYVSAQSVKAIHVDSMYHYSGFIGYGKTSTADYHTKPKGLDDVVPIEKVDLKVGSLGLLNKLLADVEPKPHSPIKVKQCSFAIAYINESRVPTVFAIFEDWGIVDVINKTQYVFKSTPYFEMFRQFVRNNFE